MTRGQAQALVFRFPDGGTILSDQPVREAEKAVAMAAYDARIDQARRDFDAAVQHKIRMFEESEA